MLGDAMEPIIEHIQITVKDMDMAVEFYDKLMPLLGFDPEIFSSKISMASNTNLYVTVKAAKCSARRLRSTQPGEF
jgi:predicted enzyme related to lactoylglutathione lyase